MKFFKPLVLIVGAAAAVALAQDPTRSSDTRQATPSTTETQSTSSSSPIVAGYVVRYEPGRVIVIRDVNNKERTFNLGPEVAAPAGVGVGSYVNLSTEANGANVTRVDVAPSTRSTTERSSTTTLPAAGNTGMTETKGMWVTGTVTSYVPGVSVSISMPGGTVVEYRLDASSELPADLAVGKTVKIQSESGATGTQREVRKLQYTTKTKTEQKDTTNNPSH